MRRKIVVAVVLCLIAVAALASGAAPALATNGGSWHSAAAEPKLAFEPHVVITNDGSPRFVLSGRLTLGGKGLSGVLIHLQERISGASEFTEVAQATTREWSFFSAKGSFSTAIGSSSTGATYRAVSEALVGPPAVEPVVSAEVLMTPGLEIWKIRGLDKVGHTKLGHSVVAVIRAAPIWLVGEKLKLTLAKGPDLDRRVVQRAVRTIRDGGLCGTCSWKIRPKSRGEYFVGVTLPATADHPRVTENYGWFVVK